MSRKHVGTLKTLKISHLILAVTWPKTGVNGHKLSWFSLRLVVGFRTLSYTVWALTRSCTDVCVWSKVFYGY